MSRFKSIAVVGAGAVGGYYGARIARELDVRFLMRGDLEVVKEGGLHIRSVDGDFHLDPVSCFGSTTEIGPVDLVITAVKATSNEALTRLLPPLLQENTAILTLQNGLGNEDFLAEQFPGRPVLGGLCFVCINRGEPGVIHHLAHGKVELGDFNGFGLASEVSDLLRKSRIECSVLPDLGLGRWRKLVWNIPFNGLSIAAGGIDVAQILADSELLKRTRALMAEVIAVAQMDGHKIDPAFAETNLEWTRSMGPYQPSSLIDFLAGREVEVEAIWGEPLRRAESLRCETPELKKLYLEICEKLP